VGESIRKRKKTNLGKGENCGEKEIADSKVEGAKFRAHQKRSAAHMEWRGGGEKERGTGEADLT